MRELGLDGSFVLCLQSTLGSSLRGFPLGMGMGCVDAPFFGGGGEGWTGLWLALLCFALLCVGLAWPGLAVGFVMSTGAVLLGGAGKNRSKNSGNVGILWNSVGN